MKYVDLATYHALFVASEGIRHFGDLSSMEHFEKMMGSADPVAYVESIRPAMNKALDDLHAAFVKIAADSEVTEAKFKRLDEFDKERAAFIAERDAFHKGKAVMAAKEAHPLVVERPALPPAPPVAPTPFAGRRDVMPPSEVAHDEHEPSK